MLAGCDRVVVGGGICNCDVKQCLRYGRRLCGDFLTAVGDVELGLMQVVKIEVEIEISPLQHRPPRERTERNE